MTAFYIGARLQLCFGIIGKRWENENFTKELINDYWSRPSTKERSVSYNSVENGCYW